jgi:hypothetical protein
MPGIFKFAIVFAVIGMIISVSFGFIGQNRLTHVLVTGFISTLISAALGAGVYKTIEIKVPELLTLFERDGSDDYEESAYSDTQTGYQGDSSDGYNEGPSVSDTVSALQDDDSTRVFGDHILVNNKVKIKNEPKLIAKAIQTMLAKDEG